MAVLMPEGRQSFEDSAGLPLVGGKLYTYIAGTSTPQQTFVDAAGTTPNTNPIILDGRGEATIFWAGSYKVVLTDADDVVIWTVDDVVSTDVTGPVDAAIALVREDLADFVTQTKGAGMVGYSSAVPYPANTVGADLNAPRPVSRGGTGANNSGDALSNLGMINIAAEVAIGSSTILTSTALGKAHVIYDNGANYSVTLPAGAPVGSILMVRVSSVATKLYTLNGNDANIDGQASRVMWAGESALLLREAANWCKIDGRSRPMTGGLQRTTSQTGIVAATNTQVQFTGPFGDPSGLNLSYNAGSQNFICRRAGNYVMSANLALAGTGIAGSGALVAIIKNSGNPVISPNAFHNAIIPPTSPRYAVGVSGNFLLAVGDAVGVIGNIGAGSSLIFESDGATIAPTLSFTEIPTW